MTEIDYYDEGGERVVWSASALGDYDKCPRYFRWRQDWEGRGTNISAVFGHCYHAALEERDKAIWDGASGDEATKVATLKALEVGHEVLDTQHLADANADMRYHVSNLCRAVVWYCTQYADDDYQTAATPSGDPCIEVEFNVPFEGTPFRLMGRVDKIVHYADGLYIVDRKTTKQSLTYNYFSYFTPNMQVSSYVWALRHLFDMPINGMIIEALQLAVTFNRVLRRDIGRTPAQIEEWYNNTVHMLNQFHENYQQDQWPMREAACGLYGGCTYRSICSEDPSLHLPLLRATFEAKERDRTGTSEDPQVITPPQATVA